MAPEAVVASGGRAGRYRRDNHGNEPRRGNRGSHSSGNVSETDEMKMRVNTSHGLDARGIATPDHGRRGAGPLMMPQSSPRLRTEDR